MAAARALLMPARPAAIDDIDPSAAALNLSPEQLAEMRARAPAQPQDPAPVCRVWACHAPVVALFDGMRSQWRSGPGGAIGLDYAVLPGVARAVGIAPRRAWALLPELQVMEDEALSLFAELTEQLAGDQAGRTLH
jgi:hypothetical protein